MSQVRKLQNGGNVKRGTLTIDGRTYEATPELIMSLSGYLSGFGDTAAPLAGLTNALTNGANVTYDSVGNTITGMSGKWVGTDEKGYDSNRSQFKRNLDATFNNDAHKFRKAVSLLSRFQGAGLTGNDPAKQTENPLDDITGNDVWFDYGDNNVYSDESLTNIGINRRLNNISKYLEEDLRERGAGDKLYRLADNWNTKMADLRAMYNNMGTDAWNARIEEIKQKAKAGTLDDNDKIFLKNLNIVESSESQAQRQANAEKAQAKQKWIDAGWNGDIFDRLGDRATIGEDGSLILNDGASWGFDLGDLNGRNIYFNDDFYNSSYGADGSFNPFRGLTLYNNRFYRSDNPTLARILNADGGFNEAMTSGNWNAADDIIATRFTKAARENVGALGNDKYAEFLSNNPNYRFSNLTGLYDVDGMTDGDQLIQYVDLSDPISNGPYKDYKYKYAILDNRGKLKSDVDFNQLREIANGQSRALLTYNRLTGAEGGSKAYKGMYYEDIVDKKGDATGFRIYRDPKDPNGNVILHMPKIKGAGIDEDVDLHLPPEVAKILMSKGDEFWGKVIGKAQNKKNLITVLSHLVQSDFRKNSWGNTPLTKILAGTNPITLLLTNSDRDMMRKLGFRNDELDALMKALRKSHKGSREDRRDDYLVTAPNTSVSYEKLGGKIENLRKYAAGGKSGGSTESEATSERKIDDVKNTNPQNAAGITEIGSKNWTDADTKDLIALAADLSGLGLTFTPAYGAAAATGAMGSLMRFSANKSRDTKGAGTQLGLDLLMDAASLVPGMKIIKETSAVRKALPTLFKAASVFGLGTAFTNTLNKIANGDKFTVRDASILVNGITAGINLKRSGGFGKSTKTKSETTFIGEDPVIKVKTGENGAVPEGAVEFKLDRKAFNESDLASPEAFKKKILSLAKQSDSNVTMENLAERYDISDFVNNNGSKWAPKWNPKTWFKKNKTGIERLSDKANFKTKTSKEQVEFTPEEIAAMSPLERWWRGLTQQNQLYNLKRQGLKPKEPSKKEYLEKIAGTKKVQKLNKNFNPNARGKELTPENGWQKVSETITPSKVRGIMQQDGTELVPAVPINSPKAAIAGYVAAPMHNTTGQVLINASLRNLDANLPVPMKQVQKFKFVPGENVNQVYEPIVTIKTARTKGVRFNRKAYNRALAHRRNLLRYQNRMRLVNPQVLLPLKLRGYEDQQPSNPAYIPDPYVAKNGGVIKAQNGITLPWKEDYKSIPELGKELTGVYSDYARTHPRSELADWRKQATLSGSARALEMAGYANGWQNGELVGDSDSGLKQKFNINQEASNQRQGGGTAIQSNILGKAYSMDPNQFINFGKAALAYRDLDKQLRNFLDRERLSLLPFLTNAPQYINTGAGNAYRNAANQARSFKATSANPIINWAMQQQQQAQARQSELQGNLADSQEYGQYLDKYNTWKNTLDQTNWKVANQNREIAVSNDTADRTAMNENISEKSKIRDTALYALQQYITEQRKLGKQAKWGETYNEMMNKYRNELSPLQEAYDTAYKADPNSQATKDAYNRIQNLNSRWKMLIGNSQAEAMMDRWPGITRNASGGKMSKVTYSKDPYPELLLNNNKDIERMVRKLNDNVYKLLLKQFKK